MDSVQVGKAVFVKEIYTTLGIEPKTYSYPGRISYHNCVCWSVGIIKVAHIHVILHIFVQLRTVQLRYIHHQ